MCSEMHTGISDNRAMINDEKEAASSTRVQISTAQADIAVLTDTLKGYIEETAEKLFTMDTENKEQANKLAEFAETVVEQYRQVFEEYKKTDDAQSNINEQINKLGE